MEHAETRKEYDRAPTFYYHCFLCRWNRFILLCLYAKKSTLA